MVRCCFVLKFAENTSGKVHVLLNGSVSDTYSEISVFRSVEVPNLPSEVRALHAWVIYDRGVPVRNLCSGASIKQLELDLRPDIVFTCEDMDRETFLQCVENPEGSQCKSVV
ncbi:ADP-ribosyl cyclase/cyclic ADP-ribose hydrolase 1-like [Talpa occidentalis]|uniref:ADP-ribosyl cyclase/cyclic ADP-ribose hydrolase 1-like n=1 Tax=Talpa occidentalis TaxID=50954 RepID=UPI00188DD9E3|nr:ADP-ribosyl cyclase/cyclic ADP-ribose hydrolase 1-like [Talpa occidentalis]